MSIYKATQAGELGQCLESLLSQTIPPNQVVLVRDGPVQSAVEQCIENYAGNLPLHHLYFTENRGLGYALRDGLKECDYELVARVDSDDRSVPERFALQVNYLKNNPSISVVGGWLKEYCPQPSGPVGMIRRPPNESLSIAKTARRRNPLNHPTVMFRKSHVMGSGNYQPCLLFEDYFLWARMLMTGYCLANIPQVLVETQINPEYFSRRGGSAYLRHELNLMKKLRAIGFLSTIDTTVFVLSRLPMRLAPLRVRQNLYRILLRKT